MRGRLRSALLARRRGTPGAGAPRPRRADGYEFAELREYVSGDDPRRIDWAATARAGALQTRVMYEDHALVLAGAIDASGSMQVGRARTSYDRAAEALRAWYALAEGDDRCVRVAGATFVADARRRGRAAALACSSVRDAPGTPFAAAVRAAAALVPRDASLLLASDFYDLQDIASDLRRLSLRCDVTALIVRDPWFDGLGVAGFVRLRDAETGEVRRLFVGRPERARFTHAGAERERSLRAELRGMGIRCGVLADDAPAALADAFGIA